VRPIRLLAAAAFAVAALTTACAKADPGTATPAGAGGGTPAATTSAAPADNGVAALTASQILTKAKTAFEQSGSVHVTGSGFSDGEQFALDMRIKGSAGGTGTLTVNQQKLTLTRIGSTLYIQADESFWRSQTGSAEGAKLLAGKYLKASMSDASFAELGTFTNLAGVAKDILATDGPLTKGARKTVNGIPAISLVDNGKDGGTMYVALQGPPLPLRLDAPATGTDDQGSLEFIEYGRPVQLTAPPANLTIDTSKLPH
jgi:hypothetical protein